MHHIDIREAGLKILETNDLNEIKEAFKHD